MYKAPFFLIPLFLLMLTFGRTWAKDGRQQTYQAQRVEQKPNIDGSLEDKSWQSGLNFYQGHFTQRSPNNGRPSAQESEIRIIYTDQAIYIGVNLWDSQADSILTQFGPRDSRSRNADMFAVYFDTYNKQQNAFMFMVSAAGVQTDAFISPNDTDENWNAVWKSAVKVHEKGWTVELEIPYSALRFSSKDQQTWGLNFMRQIRRHQETSYWNPVDISVNGLVNQFGVLEGLRDIEAPVRLSFLPYISSYLTVDGVNQQSQASVNGGMDIKYGINDAFTLDMSLIPDFGQVRSDNVVLNLSPFEVRFSENRPFFTEGTELFNKGGLFYSRRVGASFGNVQLRENEKVLSSVQEAPLLNATKLSGRTPKGLGIGVFNAITNRTRARVLNTESGEERDVQVDPLTNFNVLVFDQNLKNNSNIGFINTNVTRFGGYNANVSGADFRLNDRSNTYRISGFAALSQLYGQEDVVGTDIGYKYNLFLGKVSGKFQYSFSQNVESHDYEINDLGFLRNANEFANRVRLSYNMFEPKGKLLRMRAALSFRYNRLYKPFNFNRISVDSDFWFRFTNFWEAGLSYGSTPNDSYDYFEPRHEGYYFVRASSHRGEIWFETDSRKAIRVNAWTGMWQRPIWDQQDNWYGVNVNWRISDRFSIEHNSRLQKRRREPGYVNAFYDTNDEVDQIIFGRRNVQNITNTFSGSFAFSANMNIDLRVRHYWSQVTYLQYNELDEEGKLHETYYTGIDENGERMHDTNFNAFNVDLVFFWQFAPGSELNIVWKDAIYTSDNTVNLGFGQNFGNTLRSPQVNSFSVRVLYFLDYLYLKGSSRKRS